MTGPSAGPSGEKPYFFCMSSGISSRRSASICHWGEPVQMASVPHTTWSAPRPLTSLPIIAAHRRGCATVVWAKICPRSPYTLVTPNFAGISARSVTHSMRPVFSNCAQASVADVPPP